MSRIGLAIALTVAVVTAIVFAAYPQFDLAVAQWFYTPGVGFALDDDPTLNLLRDGAMWVVALIVAPAILALLAKIARPESRMLVRGRAVVFLLATLALGPGLAVNLTLKEYWSRPRPREVTQFGGTHAFVPWWDPRGGCDANCSFVAGEAAGAAWTFAPAALAPPHWRAAAYAGALAFTAAVGMLRVAFGGHFLSDVLLGATLVFLLIWLAYALCYRWSPRWSDDDIEQALARLGRSLRRLFSRSDGDGEAKG